MKYDVERVRSKFSALNTGIAFFDGPGGSQVPNFVGNAIAEAITSPISNRGTTTESEINANVIVQEFRQAVADLLDCDHRGVVYGRSWTQLTYDFSRNLAKGWKAGDEIIVTNLDHDSNVRPWVQAAESVGAVVRWAKIDPVTGELPPSAFIELLNGKTRLVAVTGAGNTIGTRPDIRAISAEVHKYSALLYVDGVHLTPHAPVSVKDLGADFFGFSGYKLMGPHCSVLVADPALLATIANDKLLPSTTEVPERFEFGTLPYEMMRGISAMVDFIADLVPSAGTRRERIVHSMTALEEYEQELFEYMEHELLSIPDLKSYGKAVHRTPTMYFTIAGIDSLKIYHHLATRKVNAPASNFYALEVSRALGLGDAGAVRVGLAPYSTKSDVDRLVFGVKELL